MDDRRKTDDHLPSTIHRPLSIMSSFSNPHYMYLFDLQNGKKKLAYGQSPEDALEILRSRLTEAEMAEIIKEKYVKINQRQLQEYVHTLG